MDLHTHTISSGHAYSTISENARAASKKGIKLLGMTDHGPSMPGAPNLYHFGNLSVLPEFLFGVQVLYGVEANITSHDGELDLPLRYLSKMQIVLVGMHVYCYPGGTCEQNTKAYLHAMQNPFTDIMVHPGRSEFIMDLEKIAYMSAVLNVPVEINNTTLLKEKGTSYRNCMNFAKYAAKYGGPIVLGSDAHFWDRVGEVSSSVDLAIKSGIQEEQIINTSPEKVLDYLRERRKKHPQTS